MEVETERILLKEPVEGFCQTMTRTREKEVNISGIIVTIERAPLKLLHPFQVIARKLLNFFDIAFCYDILNEMI